MGREAPIVLKQIARRVHYPIYSGVDGGAEYGRVLRDMG